MKLYLSLVFALISLFSTEMAAQTEIGPRSRDIFPYPLSHNDFVQTRFDRLNLGEGNYFDTYAIRAAHTFGGSYHLRLDLPLASTNQLGGSVFGLSDTKIRLVHARFLRSQFYVGYGGELTLPTASKPILGSGKWQAKPELGIAYFIGNMQKVKGSAMLEVNYLFDYAGVKDRNHINVLGIAPNADFWGKNWYIGYYATWTYDFNQGIWNIPLDIECGYTIFAQTTLSAEYILPLLSNRTFSNEFAFKLKYAFKK